MYGTKHLIEIVLVLTAGACLADDAWPQFAGASTGTGETVRVATFNVSLYGQSDGEIRRRLARTNDPQAQRIARVVQTVRPDILIVNELDYEPDGLPAKRLAENYFAVAQVSSNGTQSLKPIEYPYRYSAPSNTGIDSHLDLNGDGVLGAGNDAWGFGEYPGQYALAVFSRFPIETPQIRTFQDFRWNQLPGALRPIQPSTGQPFHSQKVWNSLRLSSKNHVDVPIRVGADVIHVLASHPTPPVFDGPEDLNGRRNHDEIEFWNHYLSSDSKLASWLKDDSGRTGRLPPAAKFVIAGDLNADPDDGTGRREAIQRLLGHRRVASVTPHADPKGVAERSQRYDGRGELAAKTAEFRSGSLMRVDYVIPSRSLKVVDSGVFWPATDDPRHDWISASDHRLVWVDVSGVDLAGGNSAGGNASGGDLPGSDER